MDPKLENNWRNLYATEPSRRWKFQESIIADLETYYNQKLNEDDPRAALVKLPTGSGKTAIMAVFSNYIVSEKSVLIVVPSEALKRQVKTVLNIGHWKKIHFQPEKIKKSDYYEPTKLTSFFAGKSLEDLKKEPFNYICTHHTLTTLKKSHDYVQNHRLLHGSTPENSKLSPFEKLIESVSVLFVDEGHREPAKEWSKIIRGVRKPTILFTATPYRNDLRFFNIDSNHIYELSFESALIESTYEKDEIPDTEYYGVVRNVKVIPAENDYGLSILSLEKKAESFVKQLIKFFIEIAINSYLDYPKAIIRCQTLAEIRMVQKILKKVFSKGYNPKNMGLANDKLKNRIISVSIHDRNSKSENEFTNYQTILKRDERNESKSESEKVHNAMFWIHQFKLVEGIDNDEFIVLALFSPFENARSLVQQIGRIIRKPHVEFQHFIDNEEELQLAYVFTSKSFNTKKYWDGYLAFEKPSEIEKIYGTEQIVERISSSFPEYFYFDKQFSKIVNPKFTDQELANLVEKELKISKITNVFKCKEGIDFAMLLDKVSEAMEDNDIIEIKRSPPNYTYKKAKIGIIIGWKIRPTEQLSESIFFDISFFAYSIFELNSYLFIRGNLEINNFLKKGLIERIDPKLFSTLLLSKQGDVHLKQLSVLNSDPGSRAIRRTIEGGKNLSDKAPAINDHLHVLTTAMGVVNKIPRYVGITKSRITDGRGIFISIDEYIEWITKLIIDLESNSGVSVPFINRYALYVPSPKKSIPKHILFDLSTFSENYLRIQDGQLIDEDFHESSAVIEWDTKKEIGHFKLKIEENDYNFNIRYTNGNFKIKASNETTKSINESYQPEGEDNKGAASFLRNSGIFRIITDEGWFYSDNNFFNPSIKLWGNDRFENIGLFYSLAELSKVLQEKEIEGFQTIDGEFDKSTLFHLIDRLKDAKTANKLHMQSIGFEGFIPEYLICDDQSSELGDFIAFSEKEKKVVIIHAKMGTKTSDSTASSVSFEKVTSQVIKNLRTFDPYNFTVEDFHNNWDKSWSKKRSDIKRIRRPNDEELSGLVIQNKLIKLLKKDVTREVWIMYGKGFRLEDFEKFRGENNPPFHIKHLIYSIVNCNDVVARHGAKLKIFTQP